MRLSELYSQFFTTVIADTEELKREAYRLRYDIYCVEHTFLNATDYPDKLERDEYDAHSIHVLLKHLPTGQYMGTVRTIMPKPGSKGLVMPFAEFCKDARLKSGRLLPLGSTAEISRFAISKSFRRRSSDGLYPDQDSAPDRRVVPYITLGLMTAILQVAISNNITHVCAVMDPALLRLLQRIGMTFISLGPPVEYHGLRQPCFALGTKLLDELKTNHPEYWDVVTQGGRYLPPAGSTLPDIAQAV